MNGIMLGIRCNCLITRSELIHRKRTRCTPSGMVAVASDIISLPDEYSGIKVGATIILKESWQALDRIDAERQALGEGNLFGVEKVLGSKVALFETGEVQETSVLLPVDETDAERLIWSVFADSGKPSDNSRRAKGKGKSKQVAKESIKQQLVIEARAKVMLFAKTEGMSLLKLRTPLRLCRAIAHSLIGAFCTFERRRDLR